MVNYKVLGVSSGLGVSLFPFKGKIIGNIEPRSVFHTPGNQQWKANFPNEPLFKEINDKQTFTPDVIISSPDCGSGSIFRLSRAKKFGDHNKNESLMGFFSALRRFRPKFFLFENLDGLFKSFPKERFIDLTNEYRLIEHNASVKHWGNSQINRKRLIIVGIRRDLPKKIDKYFKLPHYDDKILKCHELYGDLEKENTKIGHVRESLTDIISIHARKKMSLKDIMLKWRSNPYKKRWEIDYPGFKFTTAPGVYRNLYGDYPATARKANRQFDQSGYTLTPRQLARVQGVPDDFVIYFDDTKPKNYWINKGRTVVTKTPPYEISVWFKKKLEKSLKHI